MRQRAKQICYGIIYGMGSKTLSEQLSVTEAEATEFMETFHSKYPGIKKYINKIVSKCRKDEYVETLSGRRRYLANINHKSTAIKRKIFSYFKSLIQLSAVVIDFIVDVVVYISSTF